jgi:hypothetical protein
MVITRGMDYPLLGSLKPRPVKLKADLNAVGSRCEIQLESEKGRQMVSRSPVPERGPARGSALTALTLTALAVLIASLAFSTVQHRRWIRQ